MGSIERMQQVLELSRREEGAIVVLSAMAGTTDQLHRLVSFIQSEDRSSALALCEHMREEYVCILSEIDPDHAISTDAYINEVFSFIESLVSKEYWTPAYAAAVVGQGELLSTYLFSTICLKNGLNIASIDALDFMRIDAKGEPNMPETKGLLLPILEAHPGKTLYVTQGYICRNSKGDLDNLRRGGSDYSATIIGSIIEAQEIQIWTDIDGLRNNDPRIVDDTFPIRFISYREAAELAFFGAKILHPACVLPAERALVPLRIKNTITPDAPGTLISSRSSGRSVTAIAVKDGITAIKVYSHRMLMAYGFLRRVFQVFEDFHTPVDMITTSEVAVSCTIDDTTELTAIRRSLLQFGEVTVQSGFSIICIVGNELYDNTAHLNSIFDALVNIPLRMVSMGGSNYNISILVATEHKESAMRALNRLFIEESCTA